MRKILNAIVIVPLALVLLAFAVANRRFVTVSFNPFDSSDLSMALSLPLFVVIIVAAALGVIAGGCATWFGQRRWRRAVRRLEAEAADARLQVADLRLKLSTPVAGRTAPGAGQPIYPAIGQDKHGATL